MLDDLFVGHSMEQMEVELAVPNVRGEVLYVERFLFRETHGAQVRRRSWRALAPATEIPLGEQSHEAAVDCVGGRARELLENDRARERLEALAPRLDSKRTDFRNNPREDRVGLAEMNPRFACVVDFVGCHLY